MTKKTKTPPVDSAKKEIVAPLLLDFAFSRIREDVDYIASTESTPINKKIRFMQSWNSCIKRLEKQYPLDSYTRAVLKTARDAISQSTLENITVEESINLIHLVMDIYTKGE